MKIECENDTQNCYSRFNALMILIGEYYGGDV